MWKNSSFAAQINIDMFYGRIWSSLQKIFNFSYNMVETVDGSWGTKQDNGEWNGMVGMILRGDVEIGVASFVATNERHEAVDFSTILGW